MTYGGQARLAISGRARSAWELRWSTRSVTMRAAEDRPSVRLSSICLPLVTAADRSIGHGSGTIRP
jgi:hypothetical protein